MKNKLIIANISISIIMIAILLIDFITIKHTVFRSIDIIRSYYGRDILVEHILTASIPLVFGTVVLFEKQMNKIVIIIINIVLLAVIFRVFVSFRLYWMFESSLLSQVSLQSVGILILFPIFFLVTSITIVLYIFNLSRKFLEDSKKTT